MKYLEYKHNWDEADFSKNSKEKGWKIFDIFVEYKKEGFDGVKGVNAISILATVIIYVSKTCKLGNLLDLVFPNHHKGPNIFFPLLLLLLTIVILLTAWKVSVFGVFWSVFSCIQTEYVPEKLQMLTLFTQWLLLTYYLNLFT